MKRDPEKTLAGRLALMTEDRDHFKFKLEKAEAHIRYIEIDLNKTNRRLDQLLDGMCMGMKEANLPRRPHS